MIRTAFFKIEIVKVKQTYCMLKGKNSTFHFEEVLNMIGYTLMNTDRLDDAIKVLEFNLEENPLALVLPCSLVPVCDECLLKLKNKLWRL